MSALRTLTVAMADAYIDWDRVAAKRPKYPSADRLEHEAAVMAEAGAALASALGCTGSRLLDAIADERRGGLVCRRAVDAAVERLHAAPQPEGDQ